MKYSYSKIKDLKLREQRGISFEEIISHIEKGLVLKVLAHTNQEKYSKQEIMLVNVKDYVWVVPCEQKGDELHLKTAYKSRKYTKIYLGRDVNG